MLRHDNVQRRPELCDRAASERQSSCIDRVRQVLMFALPKLHWEQYDAHGGAAEDAVTFELSLLFQRVAHLKGKLFNPKLIDARKAGRRPDLYVNSDVDSYVECRRPH